MNIYFEVNKLNIYVCQNIILTNSHKIYASLTLVYLEIKIKIKLIGNIHFF